MGFAVLKRRSGILAVSVGALLLLPDITSAWAQQPLNREALRGLAQQFVAKVGKGLEKADDALSLVLDNQDPRVRRYFESLPDGEPLLLQVVLAKPDERMAGQTLKIDQPIVAIKEGYDVMISLTDFLVAAGFPIKVDGQKGTAQGWYIRENQKFALDVKAQQVTVSNKVQKIKSEDVRLDGEDILVRGQILAQWFEFNLSVNPQGQNMNIVSAQDWPIQEKMDRIRRQQKTPLRLPPKEPRRDESYKVAQIPNIDVNLRQSMIKTEDGRSLTSSGYTVQGVGDLLGHSANTTVIGSDVEPVGSVYMSLSKESEEANLLGPLKARYYELNDVQTVNVPFSGSAPSERGARVTNKNRFVTTDTETQIEGMGTPGWDVELYRGQQYLGGTVVGEDGRYSFEKTSLFAGENKFRIVQYGPLGELREEEKILAVAPGVYDRATGAYDVSLSQQNTRTYEAVPSQDPDRGTPHLAATYERQFTELITLKSGIQAREQNEDLNMYFYTGAVTVYKNYILNADMVTTDENTYMGAFTARKNFGRHNMIGRVLYQGEGFTTEPSAGSPQFPSFLSASVSSNGPFMPYLEKQRMTYDASFATSLRGNGNLLAAGDFAVASRFRRLLLNNGLSFVASSYAVGNQEDVQELRGFSSVRGRAWDISWRGTLDYELFPAPEFVRMDLEASKSFSKNLQGQAGFEYQFENSYSLASASLNWLHDKVIVSPTLSVDSNSAVTALVNVRFGMSYDPHTHEIALKGGQLSGKGGISAFVYLDKNGDGFFNKGDEVLPDVIVEAPQSGRTGTTDKNGETFLYDLAANKITDIVVQESSSFEPNWVAGTPGRSLRPRPGSVGRIEFPILRGGEMDGTVYISSSDDGEGVEAGNVILGLITPSGKVEKEFISDYDGYFSTDRLRPGVYYLTTDTSESPLTGYAAPRRFVITPEGATLFDQKVKMRRGYDVPFAFRSVNQPLSLQERTKVERLDEIGSQEVFLRIGPYHSEISTALSWYKLKIKNGPLASRFERLKQDEGERDVKTGEIFLRLKPKRALFLENAGAVCEQMIDLGVKCSVEVVTEYRKDYIAPSMPAKPAAPKTSDVTPASKAEKRAQAETLSPVL